MSKLDLFKAFAPQEDKRLSKGVNAVIYTRVSHHSQEENQTLNYKQF